MGRPQDLEEKLTPAARKALGELVSDYRSQLLLGASDSASRLGELHEISVHDLMVGLSRLQTRLVGPFPTVAERIMTGYLWGGLIIGALGVFTFLIREILVGRDLEDQIPLLLSLVGFTLATMGYLYLRARKSRMAFQSLSRQMVDLEPSRHLSSYLSLWREIELGLRELAASRLGESTAAVPLSKLLGQLGATELLPVDDQERLRELLSLRNFVAHGEGEKISAEDILRGLRDGERLLRRIRTLS